MLGTAVYEVEVHIAFEEAVVAVLLEVDYGGV